MSLQRQPFLESLAKASAQLGVVFLNHTGTPVSLLSDLSSIDMLCASKTRKDFIAFCQSHPLVCNLVITKRFHHSSILITYLDGSQLNFNLVHNLIRKSMKCIPVKEFTSNAKINNHDMLVLPEQHHFEYIFLKYQTSGSDFPDKFQKYFTALEPLQRRAVFQHLQAKYNLVFNTIEDVYKPKSSVRLKITIGLRKQKENSLLKMFARSLALISFSVTGLFIKRELSIEAITSPGHKKSFRRKIAGRVAFW